jgi:hypothetical protein
MLRVICLTSRVVYPTTHSLELWLGGGAAVAVRVCAQSLRSVLTKGEPSASHAMQGSDQEADSDGGVLTLGATAYLTLQGDD